MIDIKVTRIYPETEELSESSDTKHFYNLHGPLRAVNVQGETIYLEAKDLHGKIYIQFPEDGKVIVQAL